MNACNLILSREQNPWYSGNISLFWNESSEIECRCFVLMFVHSQERETNALFNHNQVMQALLNMKINILIKNTAICSLEMLPAILCSYIYMVLDWPFMCDNGTRENGIVCSLPLFFDPNIVKGSRSSMGSLKTCTYVPTKLSYF